MIIEALSLTLKNALPSHCSLGTARILVTHRSPMSLFGSMQIKKRSFSDLDFLKSWCERLFLLSRQSPFSVVESVFRVVKTAFFICSLNLNMGFSNRRTLSVRSGSPVLLAYGCLFHTALMARVLYKPMSVVRFHGTSAWLPYLTHGCTRCDSLRFLTD